MEEAGQKLKRSRERLGLKYRDVEEFSQQIADKKKNNEYIVTISRLSDIENRGAVPSIYKLYSMGVIYRIELGELLTWYGVQPAAMAKDSADFAIERTHLIGFGKDTLSRLETGEIQVPLSLDPGLDLEKTTFLSRFIQSWGVLPLMLVSGYNPKEYCYAVIGTGDWFMYPVLQPGSLVLVDETKKRVMADGWVDELDRPIYLLEHRTGWLCCWCNLQETQLFAIPHPSVPYAPLVFEYPDEVEVIGQVIGVANRLGEPVRPRTRAAAG